MHNGKITHCNLSLEQITFVLLALFCEQCPVSCLLHISRSVAQYCNNESCFACAGIKMDWWKGLSESGVGCSNLNINNERGGMKTWIMWVVNKLIYGIMALHK